MLGGDSVKHPQLHANRGASRQLTDELCQVAVRGVAANFESQHAALRLHASGQSA